MLFLALLFFFFSCFRVWAKEFKPCNPVTSDDCEGINTALSKSIVDTFKAPSPFFEIFSERGATQFSNGGLTLTIDKRWDNPSVRSNFYILFGKVEVIAKSAAGQGIISSVFLQSDDLDEIDLEWIGGAGDSVQSNYFVKGNTVDYARGSYHSVQGCHDQFHNYTIDWSINKLSFYIDGVEVRTVPNDESVQPYGYPQTPMAVFIGTWVGGDPDNQPGTISWAGGLTDMSEAPFTMEIERIIVTDYSSGSNYKYTDRSGEWSSIQTIGGEVNGRLSVADSEFSILSSGGTFGLDLSNTQSPENLRRSIRERTDYNYTNNTSFKIVNGSTKTSGGESSHSLKGSLSHALLFVGLIFCLF